MIWRIRSAEHAGGRLVDILSDNNAARNNDRRRPFIPRRNGTYPRAYISARVLCPDARRQPDETWCAIMSKCLYAYLLTNLPVTYRHREQRTSTTTRIVQTVPRRLYGGRNRLFFVTVVRMSGIVPRS